VTSAPPSNDHETLFKICLSYIVSDFDCFAETSVAVVPSVEAPSEGGVAPLSVDSSGLKYLYQKVIQVVISSAATLLVMVGMESASVTLQASEETAPVLESAAESASTPPVYVPAHVVEAINTAPPVSATITHVDTTTPIVAFIALRLLVWSLPWRLLLWQF